MNWSKPGSMEARLALMIWLKVSFFMVFPFGRPPVFLLLSSSASRGSSLRCFLVSVSSVVFLLCLHYRQESMRTSCRNRHFYCRLIGSS